MKEGEEYVLLLCKELYGIPNSGLPCFLTFSDQQGTALRLEKELLDQCINYKNTPTNRHIVVVLQLDDSLGVSKGKVLE